MELGHLLAFIGAMLSVVTCGIGSSIAVAKAGQAVAGVVAENPSVFRKVFILQLMPATQGLYGLLVAFLIVFKIGALGGGLAVVSDTAGWSLLAAALPISIVGYFSAIWQGNVAISSIKLIGKRPEANGLTMVAVVETFAIFSLLISAIMVLLGVTL